MNKATRFGVPAALVLSSGASMAAVPTEITDAVSALAVDGGTIASGVLLAIVAIYAIKFLRKAF